ncbi:hypothetical protein ACFFKC_22040 [Pseudoduganella danionis]|uniref:Lipoprotein n=2 Tax=Telluria group TaxID=2895353 RepID=A0A845I5W3_9BURK|nr:MULTISPECIES: hypothetical protein [Telluria group]MTW35426.1 hypothetical protein [Pseudoduganella danionis]MYN47625.1 hypothetical protein [Duganella fentianensis]
MNWLGSFAVTVIALLGLAGCASDPTFGVVDWQHGARRGVISTTYGTDIAPAQRAACVAALSPDQYAKHRFVLVRYQHVRLTRTAVAAVPANFSLKEGDVVELWPADCSAGGLSRISKVLRTGPPL